MFSLAGFGHAAELHRQQQMGWVNRNEPFDTVMIGRGPLDAAYWQNRSDDSIATRATEKKAKLLTPVEELRVEIEEWLK